MGRLFIVLFLLLTPAQAEAHHNHHHHYSYYHSNSIVEGSRPAGCGGIPWCGCFMRTLFGGGAEYNLARNWAHRGSPTVPHVGAVVVWPHHVGLITGQASHEWVVKSGNDGHAVRERPRSLRGVIAVRSV